MHTLVTTSTHDPGTKDGDVELVLVEHGTIEVVDAHPLMLKRSQDHLLHLLSAADIRWSGFDDVALEHCAKSSNNHTTRTVWAIYSKNLRSTITIAADAGGIGRFPTSRVDDAILQAASEAHSVKDSPR